MKFEGTKSYISTEDLSMAVNAAINLEYSNYFHSNI